MKAVEPLAEQQQEDQEEQRNHQQTIDKTNDVRNAVAIMGRACTVHHSFLSGFFVMCCGTS
jgi:hypothetical protein